MSEVVDAVVRRWPAAERGAVRHALGDVALRAQGEQPGIVVVDHELAAHAAARLPGDAEPVAALAALHAGDLAVCLRAAGGDDAAIAVLDRELREVATAAIRALRGGD